MVQLRSDADIGLPKVSEPCRESREVARTTAGVCGPLGVGAPGIALRAPAGGKPGRTAPIGGIAV